MEEAGESLVRLYLFAGACALFATAYGLLALEPSRGMALLLETGPGIGVAIWLAADARRTGLGVHDAGWLFAMTWPVAIPWYVRRTRGRGAWWLALRLYGIALCGPLGLAWGAALRAALRAVLGVGAGDVA
jgi:hypothetical protein